LVAWVIDSSAAGLADGAHTRALMAWVSMGNPRRYWGACCSRGTFSAIDLDLGSSHVSILRLALGRHRALILDAAEDGASHPPLGILLLLDVRGSSAR
jgi:hypothetical protein